MKLIGLIGGMSWYSSAEYYKIINETVMQIQGGLHSAESLMYSVDGGLIEDLLKKGEWKKISTILTNAAKKLEKGGADLILMSCNTVHKIADKIETEISVPFLHIADAAAEKIKEKGLKKVGLLGSKFTMEEDFYKGRMTVKHGLEVIIPDAEERKQVNEIIFSELVMGIIKDSSKKKYLRIIENLKKRGAQGIVLGCTEIPLLIKQDDVDIPVFSTTEIHAKKAVEFAIQ